MQLANPEPPTVDYKLSRTLGMSGHGKVRLATDPQGASVAVKIYDANNRATAERLMLQFTGETQALTQMAHRNVVRFIASSE